MKDFLERLGWQHIRTLEIPPRGAEYLPVDKVPVSSPTRRLLKGFPNGLYVHQLLALEEYLSGKNLCISTATASGKTLIFHAAACEEFSKYPNCKVLVIYPLKALIAQQFERWQKALGEAECEAKISILTGDTDMEDRLRILVQSNIVLMTPDVIHSWLMYKIGDSAVKCFLSKLKLLIVDEVHTYTGVFGSNAAFLFRRLFHATSCYGSSYKIIAASATISNPNEHLHQLFGCDFAVVDEALNTSPRNLLRIHFVDHPEGAKIDVLKTLLENILHRTQESFMMFVDSRKQVELLATSVNRGKENEVTESDNPYDDFFEPFRKYDILPFRSGYEEEDRKSIQDRLERGTLRGVICTSAMELGLDIPHVSLGILVGVPKSSTSFLQRIGRIGRKKDGTIIVIKTSSPNDNLVFLEPERILHLPPVETTLYLQNHRLQYVHALCLARSGGEYDQICERLGQDPEPFSSPINWPSGFLELCKREREGDISGELGLMKAESQDDPNHYYPLRDIGIQFEMSLKVAGDEIPRGQISYDQLMREAYPGAVYYYATQPYRVCYVDLRNHKVILKKERYYTTKPISLPSVAFPNFSRPIQVLKRGNMILAEVELQIKTIIQGFTEKRGPSEIRRTYPIKEDKITFHQSSFTRFFFTTGVLIYHPSFCNAHIQELAQLIHSAFHTCTGLEVNDTNFTTGKTRQPNGVFPDKETRYVVIYDETYGSLRITSKLLEDDVIINVLEDAIKLCGKSLQDEREKGEVLKVLRSTIEDAKSPPQLVNVKIEEETFKPSENCVKIIKPGSIGIRIIDNQEVKIKRVFYSTKGLMYEIEPLDSDRTPLKISAEYVQPLEGESITAYYDLENGNVVEMP
ncbi:DEAD/DEAH box helicase [Pseudothermotoga sp. U03pept]|uniref:DEAD/DEAH box helicase n=1 Tax=Pseudothermotoga sp. U03pept TaxID=3447012 RepID=UPI003F128DEA